MIDRARKNRHRTIVVANRTFRVLLAMQTLEASSGRGSRLSLRGRARGLGVLLVRVVVLTIVPSPRCSGAAEKASTNPTVAAIAEILRGDLLLPCPRRRSSRPPTRARTSSSPARATTTVRTHCQSPSQRRASVSVLSLRAAHTRRGDGHVVGECSAAACRFELGGGG